MKHPFRLVILGTVLSATWTAVGSCLAADKQPTPEQIAFFEKNIRPVLVKECYSCHSATAEKITRRPDARHARRHPQGRRHRPGRRARRPEEEPAHQGDQAQPTRREDAAEEEAARRGDRRLREVGRDGRPDPRDGAAKVVKSEIDIEKGRKFWAFQPPKKTAPPDGEGRRLAARPTSTASCSPDWKRRGSSRSADADPRTLLRRLYFRPDRPAADARKKWKPSSKDYAASRKRPSRRWSTGCWPRRSSASAGAGTGSTWPATPSRAAGPPTSPIRTPGAIAITSSPPSTPTSRTTSSSASSWPATCCPRKDDKEKAEFLDRHRLPGHRPEDRTTSATAQQFQMDVADEQIDATFQAFLGLTVACARCHDHKFDPIPQKDYYALAGIFRSTETCYGTIRVLQSNHPSPLLTLPKDAGVHDRAGAADGGAPGRDREADRRTCKDQMAKLTGHERVHPAASSCGPRIATLAEPARPCTKPTARRSRWRWACASGSLPADSRLYIRGELDQPGETVKRGFPQVLTTKQPTIGSGSGRLRTGRLDRLEGQSADGPRDGQPRLAAPDRPRPGADARQLRRLRPAAEPSGAARPPGRHRSSTTAGR